MPFIETAKYPVAVAGVADLFNAKDNARGSLLAAISAASLTFTLLSGEGPEFAADNGLVSVDAEIIFYTSRTGDVFTTLAAPTGRGFQGTAAAAHGTGAIVEHRPTAGYHNRIAAEIGAVESELGVNLLNVFGTKPTAISANTTLTGSHKTVLVTTGATDKTITLPSAVGIAGRLFFIKKVDSGAGKVLIRTQLSQTIDGNTVGYDLLVQWQAVALFSDGANWLILFEK